LRGQHGITADQCGGRIVVSLGLEDPVAVDGAELADRAVDRADEIGVGQRPGARLAAAA
jgi:hypothetical protein